jgi:tetratricopeptide (TPR) repeat protein
MVDNSLLNEVQEALLNGDHTTAKDILMKLVRGDQKNPIFWLYLSAVMETKEEKTSCLQNVLRLDPENIEAKKGLRLLGEVDEIDAFSQIEWKKPSVSRVFSTDFYSLSANEDKKKEKTPEEIKKQKNIRIAVASIGFVTVLGLLIFRPFAPTVYVYPTATVGEVFSLVENTATLISETIVPTKAAATATPGVHYTATPEYVSTQHTGDYYRLAMNSIRDGEWEEAIYYLNILTKTEEEKADIYYHIGEAYEMSGDYRKAYSNYGLSVKEDFQFGPGYLGIARMEMELYSVESSKENLDKALKYAPDFVDVYLLRADYFTQMGLFEKALVELDEAESLSSENGYVYLKRAQVYYDQSDYEKALAQALLAKDYFYRMNQESPLLAQIYLALGEGDEALVLYQEYMKANPEDLFGELNLGLAYLTMGDYDKAIDLFEGLTDVKGVRNYAFTYLGRAYLDEGDLEKALPALSSGAALNPYSYEAHYYLAKGYEEAGQSTNGFRSYVSALKQEMTDPQRIQVLYEFALFCENFDLKDEAERYWDELGRYSSDELPENIYEDLVERYPKYKPTSTMVPTSTPFATRTATVVTEE